MAGHGDERLRSRRVAGRAVGGCGEEMLEALAVPAEGRLHLVERALLIGHTVDDVAAASGIDPWFVDQIAEVVEEASACTDERCRRWRQATCGRRSAPACPTRG